MTRTECTLHRGTNRRTAAGAAALVLITMTATGCSSAPTPGGATQQPLPQTRQADAVAANEFGLMAGGGWAQAWGLWSSDAQQAISQSDFVKLNTDCKPVLGVPYVIDTSTKLDPTTVRIDWHRATVSGSSTLVHASGRWQFIPDPGSLADYRLGVTKLVQQRRAAGSCH